MVETEEAIVDGVETKLGPNVPHSDSREGHVRLLITDLDDEGVDAMALALGVQLGNYDTVVRCVTHWRNMNSFHHLP